MPAPAANVAAPLPVADWFEQLATGVALLDGGALFARANNAFCELTGFGLRRLIGQPLSALGPDTAVLDALSRRVAQTSGGARAAAVEVCAQPGAERRLDFTLTRCAEGVLLEAHPAALSAPVAQVSESLRGFAHEVRNPLAAISGAAQLLQQREADPRRRELACLIAAETQRLAALADRLLGARASMAPRAFNVHAPLERAVQLLAAERVDIEIARDYDPSLPALHGDPDRVLQLLLNLVRNAAEADAHRIALRTRAEAGLRDATGRTLPALRIEIEDDGRGVPAHIEATLFEPMVSGRADGTGLGLALAREIAREHGGELTHQRRNDRTCFALVLPRRLAGTGLPATNAHGRLPVAGKRAPAIRDGDDG